MLAPEARHLVIRGRVQGVGFRYSMAREAARLALTGWVRNRLAGTVEAVTAGPAEAIATMLAWARQGPPTAHVEHVAVELVAPQTLLEGTPAGRVDGRPPAFDLRSQRVGGFRRWLLSRRPSQSCRPVAPLLTDEGIASPVSGLRDRRVSRHPPPPALKRILPWILLLGCPDRASGSGAAQGERHRVHAQR